MKDEILENHKLYLERKALYDRFGYDVDREREFILRQASPVTGRILEAGTGKGHFALALARAGHAFVSFDISSEEQRVARLNLVYCGLENSVDMRIENGEHTRFPDASFDTIFCVNVLHHLQKPYRVLEELVRLLAPCGKLILADFTEEGFKIMDQIHALDNHAHEVGKVTLSDVEACLVQKGFSVRMVKSAHQRVLVARQNGEPSA